MKEISGDFCSADFIWALQTLCAAHRRSIDTAVLSQQFPPPYDKAKLVSAARALGFRARMKRGATSDVLNFPLPLLAQTKQQQLILVVAIQGEDALVVNAQSAEPETWPMQQLEDRLTGDFLLARLEDEAPGDPDAAAASLASFGFRWFVPELLKHRRVWLEILGASLVLQLLALAMPLFTQAIIDKVVVHRTESTLVALATGMGLFAVFSSLLTWVRQFAILHTGNRIDAVLGASVFRHLFQLPLKYFQNRPTGVIAARLHGVETIREFLSSAAVSLVLDIPFLLICVALMFYYSVPLTLIVLGVLAAIVVLSLVVAPVFQARLNEQFLLGARNQAFVTEYVGGLETVKSLQLEPQLQDRYEGFLASYLRSGFLTKQIGNTYNVVASALEQFMTLMIIVMGAWYVMHPEPATATSAGTVFTIGMLVAFQMFAGKLSQPMLRLVGLWQQFQQASLAVERLGDLMNAPPEPYRLAPGRAATGRGRIELLDLGFRYGPDLPLLYSGVKLTVEPGEVIAVMGASGSGKSTLTKLLQGFYRPTEGAIRIDDVDIAHMSANELRAHFGVVPQETVLFSGTIQDNLLMANPLANFEQLVEACRVAEIHDVVQALPQGYLTTIGERGAGLSGGQKQRLAIARALLKRPRVLIFDEATSALDPSTAGQFAATINNLRGKITMLFVTHALPKNLHVDQIYVIGGGHLRQAVQKAAA